MLPALAVVAAACGNGSGATATGPEAFQDDSWVECQNPEESYVLSRPADWHVTKAGSRPCQVFDPDRARVDAEAEDRDRAAVVIDHRDVPFRASAADPPEGEEVVASDEDTVDGRPAVRLETEAGEASDLPAGTRVTRWTVDLRAGRTLVARTTDRGEDAYGMRQEILDRMVTSIRWFESGTLDEGREPVGEAANRPVESEDQPRAAEEALLADVRAAGHDGFDRVVVELTGAGEPAYRVAPVEPPIGRDDIDEPVPIEGEAFLEIRLPSGSLLDASGDRSYEGEDRIPVAGGDVVTEVVRTGGTAGPVAFTVGLDRAAPFAVDVLADPTRLVVDIVHEE